MRPGRDLVRGDVQDARRDLTHYSAQIAVVFGTGECSREAKGEANVPNQAPAMLYGGEALAEALVDAGLGATKRLIEWLEYDDDFFATMGAGEALPDVEGETPQPVESGEETGGQAPTPSASQSAEPREDRGPRRGRDRGRNRRPRENREGQPSVTPPVVEGIAPPAGDVSAVESAPPPPEPNPFEMPTHPPAVVEAPPAGSSAQATPPAEPPAPVHAEPAPPSSSEPET